MQFSMVRSLLFLRTAKKYLIDYDFLPE